VKIERSEKKEAAGECALILKRDHATEEDAGSEDAQVSGHRGSDEGIAAAVSHPMSLDSEQTSRDDSSTDKHSRKRSTSKAHSKKSRRQWRASVWGDRLSELADFRKIHGHCNVPKNYSENSMLAIWVGTQRDTYRLHLVGKTSPMTLSRIQELENLGVEWKPHNSRKKGNPKKPSLDDDTTLVREQRHKLKKTSAAEKSVGIKLTARRIRL
jgi:hypothetical protein